MTPLRTVTRLRGLSPFVGRARRHEPSQSPIVLIYDQRIAELSREAKQWIKRFPCSVPVRSGEELKTWEGFRAFMDSLPEEVLQYSRKSMEVWAMGGGSVGDFAGFFASVWKRGVTLRMVPTTWLSAIDSAHGGKTGLNWGGAKNQIGTFYPAQEVILVRELLELQGEARMRDGMGELAKIALIDGGRWTQELRGFAGLPLKKQKELMWRLLPDAARSKWKWVKKDPRELNGAREVLNLGHTLGHVLEVEVPLSHGEAVAQGLLFALDLSLSEGLMSEKAFARAQEFLRLDCGIVRNPQARVSRSSLSKRVKADKKRNADGQLSFVFLERMGRPVRKPILMEKWIRQVVRGGWTQDE